MWPFYSPRQFLANLPRLCRNLARSGTSRPLCWVSFGGKTSVLLSFYAITNFLKIFCNQRKDVNALDGEFDVIYVNGSNNVPNLKKENDGWKARLIEEDFRARMWEGA